jgi:hypothetical protein
MTEQPAQRPQLSFGQEYQELAKRRDAHAACAAEMVNEGLWDTAAAFARLYKAECDQIATLLGLDPRAKP